MPHKSEEVCKVTKLNIYKWPYDNVTIIARLKYWKLNSVCLFAETRRN